MIKITNLNKIYKSKRRKTCHAVKNIDLRRIEDKELVKAAPQKVDLAAYEDRDHKKD